MRDQVGKVGSVRVRVRFRRGLVLLAAVVLTPIVGFVIPAAEADAPQTLVTWLSGIGNDSQVPHYVDGPANQARFWNPEGGAVSPDGAWLYVADNDNNAIRKVDTTTGEVSTLAGVTDPHRITIGPDGALYVTTGSTNLGTAIPSPPARVDASGPDKVVRVTTGGAVSDYAGGFFTPIGLVFDGSGKLWVSDESWTCGTPAGCGGDGGSVVPRISSVVGGARQTAHIYPNWGWFQSGTQLRVVGSTMLADLNGQIAAFPVGLPQAWVNIGYSARNDFDTFAGGAGLVVLEDKNVFAYALSNGMKIVNAHLDDIWDGMKFVAVDPARRKVFAITDLGRIYTTTLPLVFGDGLGGLGSLGSGLDPRERCGCNILAPHVDETAGYEADPVDTGSGSWHQPYQDFAIPGHNGGLSWNRAYNSIQASVDGPLGFGWSFDAGMKLTVDGSQNVTVYQGGGALTMFVPTGGGQYTAPPRVAGKLVKNGDNSYTLTTPGEAMTYRFNSSGQLVASADRNHRGQTETTYAYQSGKLSSITDPAGRQLAVTWTGSRITKVRDPQTNREVVYTYNGANELWKVTDVAGAVWEFGYDANHRLTTVRDPRQASNPTPKLIVNAYDGQGRVTSQTDQLDRVTAFDYATIPGATKITSPEGRITIDRYEAGIRTATTRGWGTPEEATWLFAYDPATLGIASVAEPAGGGVTSAQYDAQGNMTRQVDALGRITESTYNSFNEPLTITRAKGTSDEVVTTYTYDPSGNPKTESTPLIGASPAQNQLTTLHYDQHPGDLTRIVDARGNTWQFGYDQYGVRNQSVEPTGANGVAATTRSSFDAAGRIEWTVTPKGYAPGGTEAEYKTIFTTDAYGAVRTVRDPYGIIEERHYDANRNIDWEKDKNNHTTSYEYDAANQLRFIRRPDTTSLENTYWNDGGLHKQIDGATAATTYTYDGQGRLKTSQDPLLRTTTYRYDPSGNLTSRQDPGGTCPSGSGCTTYTYDSAHQPITINYSDPATPDVTATTYDKLGRRLSQSLSDGRVYGWQWDSLGRLTRTTDPDTTAVGYKWDLNNNLTKIAYPGGTCDGTPTRCVTRGYDNANNWTTVTDWNGKTTTFGYDANDNNTGITFPTGTSNTDTFTYDRNDRMLSATWKQGATTLGAETYTRTNSGQLASITPVGGSAVSYQYDNIDRLKSLAGVFTYNYDNADNLTKLLDNTRLVSDPANQLCFTAPAGTTGTNCTTPDAGSTVYGHDNRGNRTTVTPPNGRPSTMTYDQGNRLASVNQGAEGEFTAIPQYTYLNTTNGTGTCSPSPCAQVAANATITVDVTGGWAGIPDTGVRAVMLNVTASGSTAAGYATVYPADLTAVPGTSNLNFAVGETVSNAVVAKISPDGRVKVKNGSTGTLHLRIEATGWFKEPSGEGGTTFEPVTPTRLMWTAQGGTNCTPSPCALVAGNSSFALDVTGPNPANNPVPATGVSAVAINITAITTAAAGNLKVYQNGATEPAQPSLYWTAGETHAAMVIVPVDANGNIRLKNMSTGTTHLIVDVQGYFTTAPDSTPNVLKTVNPARIVNTATSTGTCTPNCNRFTAGSQKTIQISGLGGIPTTGVTAASITLTAVNGSANGWLEAAPNGSFVQGATSIVNYQTGENVANAAIIKLPADGKIVVYSSQAVDVIIDVNGYFAAPESRYDYTYDGDGLRRSKAWNFLPATYRYSLAEDLPMLLEENFVGVVRTSYIYGPGGLPIEQIVEVSGSITSMVWYHHDQIGSTRLLTDDAGNWRTKYAFDPYGNTSAIESNPAQATTTTNLQYAGQLTDNETGYQYLRARFYDPTTGRFLTRDPANAITRSSYGYGANAPTNYTDPTGLMCWNVTDRDCLSHLADNLMPDNARPPDYITVDLSAFAPIGELPAGPGGGLNVVITRGGDVYVGPQGGVGVAGGSIGIKGGWINTSDNPCDDEINSFVDGGFVTLSGGGLVQGGASVNGSGQTATELGIGFGPSSTSLQTGYMWSPFSLPFGLGW